jgi:hypothetical protein
MPYDRFVAGLIDPTPASAGFTKGIVWRGVVNASQTPEMQAAQNISQVFMGVNLKCASCHDSFINDWQLADAYGLAGIYAEGPLQMVECDRPLRQTAPLKFIYPELGAIDASSPREARIAQLAGLMTGPRNGRLSKTIVNRLWSRFMGRGLVEPVDDMEQIAWQPDLLDWLAADLVANRYDLQATMTRILTSEAYRMAAVDEPEPAKGYVFRGPSVRRLTAEQFVDALSSVTGVWQPDPAGEFDFTAAPIDPPPVSKGQWIWAADPAASAGPLAFRAAFTIAGAPSLAQVLVASDRAFVLHVNGRKVGDYRAATAPRLIGVAAFLQPGPNTIALATTPRPAPAGAAPTSEPVRPALLVEIVARGPDETSPLVSLLGSDTTWMTSAQPGDGWERAAAAGSGWSAAVAVSSPSDSAERVARVRAAAVLHGRTRASLTVADPLTLALGRPTREQVMTTRVSAATTLQLLELTNGDTLSRALKRGAERLLSENGDNAGRLVSTVYERALGRPPTRDESRLCKDVLGRKATAEGVEDLLWGVAMLPEFQLIR